MERPSVSLDATDLAILEALSRDGRATLQQVADRVGLRRPSVHARVRRLEEAQVIRGYTADVAPDAVDAGLVAFVLLTVDCGGADCMTSSSRVATALRALPEVLEYHTIAGREDALAKVRARDVRDLERVVTRSISGTPGVQRVHTLVVLSTHFERSVTVRKPSPRPRSPLRRGAAAR